MKNDGSPTDIEFSIGGKPNKITVGSIDGSIIGPGEGSQADPVRKWGSLNLEESSEDKIIIDWIIAINERYTPKDQIILGNVLIVDELSPGHKYVLDDNGLIAFSELNILI